MRKRRSFTKRIRFVIVVANVVVETVVVHPVVADTVIAAVVLVFIYHLILLCIDFDITHPFLKMLTCHICMCCNSNKQCGRG